MAIYCRVPQTERGYNPIFGFMSARRGRGSICHSDRHSERIQLQPDKKLTGLNPLPHLTDVILSVHHYFLPLSTWPNWVEMIEYHLQSRGSIECQLQHGDLTPHLYGWHESKNWIILHLERPQGSEIGTVDSWQVKSVIVALKIACCAVTLA